MNTLILNAPGTLAFADSPVPHSPGPGEALVRVRAIGVCGTDYHAFQGEQPFFSYPRILGHELGVEVVALGDDVEGVLSVGARCALEPYFNCGTCAACRRGKTNCCERLKVFGVHIDGGMREMAVVPAAKLHPSATLTFEQLALVEPLSIGAHAVARGALEPGEQVLVVGAGPIGLSVIQFALLAGAQVQVLDLSESRLAFCRRLYPQAATIEAGGVSGSDLLALLGSDLPTAVFDATGNPRSMMTAFSYVASGGRLIFVGLFQGEVTFHDPEFHRREMTLLATRNAVSTDVTRIIGALERGQIDLAPWVTHRATFEQVPEALPRWLERDSGVIKAVVTV